LKNPQGRELTKDYARVGDSIIMNNAFVMLLPFIIHLLFTGKRTFQKNPTTAGYNRLPDIVWSPTRRNPQNRRLHSAR
jgi:hypothetical protein